MAAATRKRIPKARRAGRPPGDGPDQRERLLDAALACYSRKGIAATSLRSIASEAGVNPALVHYYFGDKLQLQDAVVQERVMAAFETVRAPLLRADGNVASLVAGFVSGMGDAISRYPWLPALWVREVLCEGGALRSLLMDRVAPAIPQVLATRFAAAQGAGELNPQLDPRLLVVSLVGLTLFPAAGAPIWRQMFQAEDIDADAMREHTIALLDRGLGLP
ncbi:MAG: TetR family transcriptional regulator [Xanthomonadaceae bacterium]|nr:TetR family transcriptional regulator [Xanthomonadaceae bacterium]